MLSPPNMKNANSTPTASLLSGKNLLIVAAVAAVAFLAYRKFCK